MQKVLPFTDYIDKSKKTGFKIKNRFVATRIAVANLVQYFQHGVETV